ncbi:MAG: DUF502 domain-containing protein [Phycisphaeraceae bacterium]
MEGQKKVSARANFRNFFLRGLAILLPTVLTIWILIAAYGFVQQRIAGPINVGVRELIVRFSSYPQVLEEDIAAHEAEVAPATLKAWRDAGRYHQLLVLDTRRDVLKSQWQTYAIALDMIGLVIAVVLIYIVGAVLGSFIGRRLYHRGEELIAKVPLIRKLYPSVKQVTDFLVGPSKDKERFSKVVAVEYPRKGLWSLGLVTGETMRNIQDRAGVECVTVFIPSSPTPFTGYVITVPQDDTIPLPLSIEDALRFTVSGGVLIPPNQQITPVGPAAAVDEAPQGQIESHTPGGDSGGH